LLATRPPERKAARILGKPMRVAPRRASLQHPVQTRRLGNRALTTVQALPAPPRLLHLIAAQEPLLAETPRPWLLEAAIPAVARVPAMAQIPAPTTEPVPTMEPVPSVEPIPPMALTPLMAPDRIPKVLPYRRLLYRVSRR